MFATGLATPWGMAFLPDGRLLVTQKGGLVGLVSADGSHGFGADHRQCRRSMRSGQGGLLDVALDPQFNVSTNRRVYLTTPNPVPTEPTAPPSHARTSMTR